MVRNYHRFFSLNLYHEYYLNRKCPHLDIIPTPDCQMLFRRLNMHGRQIENQYVALIGTNEAQDPFINFGQIKFYRADYGQSIFRFYVSLKDPVFLNYTNLQPTPRKIFYFSNRAANFQNNYLNLTVPLEEYTTNKLYQPGKLVRDGKTGQVYEANSKHLSKKKTDLNDLALWAPKGLPYLGTPVAPLQTGKNYQPGDLVTHEDQIWEAVRQHICSNGAQLKDANFWLNRGTGQLQYPTGNDQIDFSNGNYLVTLPEPVNQAEISILGFNYHPENPAYDVPVSLPQTQHFSQPVSQVNVQLNQLPAGKYQIVVNKETVPVYYDPNLPNGKVLGVIEIFNFLPGDNPYALLTDEEKFKIPAYSIFFPTRRVLWKYIRKDDRAQTITDTGHNQYQFDLTGDAFISTVPIPLSEGVIKTLKLEFNTSDFKLAPLPNPSGQRFSKCHRDDYDYICSEMYLNY